MEYYATLGMLLIGLTVVISVLASFSKFTNSFSQPINELKIAIENLNISVASMKELIKVQEERITKHGNELNDVKVRLTQLETEVHIHHAN